MYRLVLYCLMVLWAVALIFSFTGILAYQPTDVIFSGLLILFTCWFTNSLFGSAFEAPTNVESVYITALILALIITPVSVTAGNFYDKLWFLVWVSVWAMASKFILAIRKKHIFNPAAFAVALTALTINQSASWWIGTSVMLPFVLAAGFLMVRKIIRWDLVLSFLAAAGISLVAFALLRGADPLSSLQKSILDSPIFFFAFVMLTEPLTTPPTKWLRICYGVFVGLLFAPSVHIGPVYSTPELALLTGNVLSYLISPKIKLMLRLKKKVKVTPDVYDFVFIPDRQLKFKAGQYLEWTISAVRADSRGNRRYFTIASSPTESKIHMGVKFYPEPSTFKRSLDSMNVGDMIVASQLAGDFVLPNDAKQKLVFIAGGIGITPFRSMIKYLLDTGQPRDVVLLYSGKTQADHAYRDIFDAAREQLGINTIYVATDTSGFITAEMIRKEIPDFNERTFYISGPRSMVVAFEDALKNLGVSRNHIKTDFFPGFA